MQNYFTRKNIITAFGLIAFAIIGRMLLQAMPNVETLMVVSIIAGAILGPYLGLLVSLLSVIGSDVLIGNTSILVFTWSAWAFIGIASTLLKRKRDSVPQKIAVWSDSLKFTAGGALGTLFFYLWTNFGVWLMTAMYPKTWEGLMQSYIMALPFLRNQFVGNMIIIPAVSIVFLTAWKYAPALIKNWQNRKVVGTVLK